MYVYTDVCMYVRYSPPFFLGLFLRGGMRWRGRQRKRKKKKKKEGYNYLWEAREGESGKLEKVNFKAGGFTLSYTLTTCQERKKKKRKMLFLSRVYHFPPFSTPLFALLCFPLLAKNQTRALKYQQLTRPLFVRMSFGLFSCWYMYVFFEIGSRAPNLSPFAVLPVGSLFFFTGERLWLVISLIFHDHGLERCLKFDVDNK